MLDIKTAEPPTPANVDKDDVYDLYSGGPDHQTRDDVPVRVVWAYGVLDGAYRGCAFVLGPRGRLLEGERPSGGQVYGSLRTTWGHVKRWMSEGGAGEYATVYRGSLHFRSRKYKGHQTVTVRPCQ